MSDPRPEGARGFDRRYWDHCYDDPELIDGVHNARALAVALEATFDAVDEPVSSVADFGFGLGHLFHEMLQAFAPERALGIEPSPHAFEEGRRRVVPPPGTRLELERVDLLTWCRRPDHPSRRFDLGICASVLQYLSDEECREVVPVLAERVRWLYLAVPTDREADRMKRDLDFVDPWAIQRPVAFYRDLLSPCFERVGLRLLESRARIHPDTSPFWDDLYRGW